MMSVLLVASVLLVSVRGHGDHHHQERAQKLHQRWGVADFIRDTEHIKEDVKAMMELTEIGELTQNQMMFYLIKMHDFDNNGGLDGIELWTALSHSMEHFAQIDYKDLEELVDEVLGYDDSGDGVVDYGEFRKHSPSTQ